MDVYGRLEKLKITLPEKKRLTSPLASAVAFGDNLMYISGVGPLPGWNAERTSAGKVGGEFSKEEGCAAARSCAIAQLGVLHHATGDLNRVKKIVKVLGFVNCTPDFCGQPAVVDGFSRLMTEVFEETGRHARSAVGVNSLPFNIPVEVEMLVELR